MFLFSLILHIDIHCIVDNWSTFRVNSGSDSEHPFAPSINYETQPLLGALQRRQ